MRNLRSHKRLPRKILTGRHARSIRFEWTSRTQWHRQWYRPHFYRGQCVAKEKDHKTIRDASGDSNWKWLLSIAEIWDFSRSLEVLPALRPFRWSFSVVHTYSLKLDTLEDFENSLADPRVSYNGRLIRKCAAVCKANNHRIVTHLDAGQLDWILDRILDWMVHTKPAVLKVLEDVLDTRTLVFSKRLLNIGRPGTYRTTRKERLSFCRRHCSYLDQTVLIAKTICNKKRKHSKTTRSKSVTT